MKRRTKGVALVLGVIVLTGLVAPVARAQFLGIPQVVFDPTSYATLGHIWTEDISTGAKIVQEINQLTKIYTNAYQDYMLAQAMAQSMAGSQRLAFMTMVQAGVNDYTRSQYNETLTWPQMMNGSPALAPGAWASATLQVPQFPALPADPRLASSFQSNVASLEIADGSSSKCLQTVAQYRQNVPQAQAAFSALQAALASEFPALNSHIAQLNQLNAGQSQATAEAMAHGALEGCLVEQQVIANKIQRDAIARDLNYQQHAQTVLANNPHDWDGQPAQFHLP